MSSRCNLDRLRVAETRVAPTALCRSATTFRSCDAVVEQLGGKVETRVKGPTHQMTTGATAVREISELDFARPELAVDERLYFQLC
jgi:hypothetical protein